MDRAKMIPTANKNRIDYFVVFFLAFLPRLYYCMQAMPVRTISDEVATISTAALFAGLDWSRVVSNAGYYGGGFTILLTPLFMLTDDPIVIYRAALVFCSILQSLVAPISYHLMRKYFHVESRAFLLTASVASAYMVVTRTNIVYNEHMLTLLVWLLAWLLCALFSCGDQRKKRRYTALLVLLLSYALTVHIRSAVLWIAVFITILAYYIASRKWLVSKLVLVPGSIVGYLLSGRFISYIQKKIWLIEAGEAVRNSTISLSTSVSLRQPVTWKAWLSIILGQIHTIGLYSGAILVIAVAAFVPLITGILFSKKKRTDQHYLYFILTLPFMLSIGGTIAGQSISWLSGLVAAIQGESDYGFKAVTYIRYFGPYCGPVFMAALLYLRESHREWKRIASASLFLLAALQFYWILVIVPWLDGVVVSAEIFTEFVGAALRRYSEPFMYVLPLCFLFLFYMAIMVLYKKKKATAAAAIAALLLVWEYGTGSDSYDLARGSFEKALSGYTLISRLEEAGADLPDEIYVVDTSGATDHNTWYLYQFYLNRYTIIPDYPDVRCNEAIVLCNSKNNSKLLSSGYQMYQLDSNEWIYVLGDSYVNIIEAMSFG